MKKENIIKRLHYLEEQKMFMENALELAVSLGDFQENLHIDNTPNPILKETLRRINCLELFSAQALYLTDEQDNSFNLQICSPDSSKTKIEKYVDFLIDSGFFASALHEQRGLILPSEDYSCQFFAHPLATVSRVRGMFIARFKPDLPSIPDTSLSITSLILRHSANAMENFALYKLVKEQNQILEKRVLERTRQLEYQATHDVLTGLANRYQLILEIENILSTPKSVAALLLLDIDNFREINDALGHFEGDKLLAQFGKRLQTELPSDIFISRHGGDEFALLCLQANCEQRALDLAQKITKIIKDPFIISGHPILLEGSIGIVMLPQHAQDSSSALRKADVAMFVAKKERSRFRIYDQSMDHYSMERLALMGDLVQAIDIEDDFYLAYQPKIHLPSNKLYGVEALIRWKHPKQGMVPPGKFVPLAEQCGAIKKMTMMVLKLAVSQAKKWQLAGHKIPIGVNLSMLNLQDPELAPFLNNLIKRYDLPPKLLELEITESVVMTAPSQGRNNLEMFREMGFKLYIDDFGTGYSSLSYLKKLPVHSLKIDSSFVIPMCKDEHSKIIVESIIRLGQILGLEIVAEGIEDQTTMQTLSQMGCDVGQGYHICRPISATELEKWLAKRNLKETNSNNSSI